MGQVSVSLNGRAYLLECDDGEEEHLLKLAETLEAQIKTLKARFGQIGDERLMLMAGLMVADELAETRAKLDEVNATLDDIRQNSASTDELIQSAQEEIAGQIGAAAERIEALNAVLADSNPIKDE